MKLKDGAPTSGNSAYGSSLLEASGGGNLTAANGVYT